MRFDGYDPNYAILRAGDGRPFKAEADVATTLPDRIYAFNEQLFTLLCTAFENDDLSVLDSLWSTERITSDHMSLAECRSSRGVQGIRARTPH